MFDLYKTTNNHTEHTEYNTISYILQTLILNKYDSQNKDLAAIHGLWEFKDADNVIVESNQIENLPLLLQLHTPFF